MSSSLGRLQQDHRNVNLVLTSIEKQADRAMRGLQPDIAFLNAAIAYFREYFFSFHQPKEDLIFGHLIGHGRNFASEIFPLLDDHRAFSSRVDELERSMRAVNGTNRNAHRRFGEAASRFIKSQREHLLAEEKYFYPEAERILSSSQWAEVDRYLPHAKDPLSQGQPPEAFAPLVRAVRLARDANLATARKQEHQTPGTISNPTAETKLRIRALARWENEGGYIPRSEQAESRQKLPRDNSVRIPSAESISCNRKDV